MNMEGKTLNEEKVIEISNIKKEPKWMTEFRLKSYHKLNHNNFTTLNASSQALCRSFCSYHFLTVHALGYEALRCNGLVAGPNSAGSFYVLSYYTLL